MNPNLAHLGFTRRSFLRPKPFEWDIQLSNIGRNQLGWASRDKKHLTVSLKGKITHR